ncbi:MAG: hypothetical protein K1X75_15585 [Leptospirales bacterium]|nr:hypothetical protein [Leptospirales bacterium]
MKTLNSMIASVAAVGGRSVVLLTPRPPDAMESRSPGITSSVEKYNSMKKDSPANVLVLSVEALEAELLLDDGHHLTTRGHEQVAALIWEALRPDLIPTLEPQQFQHQRGPMERC